MSKEIKVTLDGFDGFSDYQSDVEEFMYSAEQDVLLSCEPTFDKNNPQIKLYMNLVEEEFHETLNAYENGDTVELADGLADMVWVIMGLASSVGIDFESVWQEVKDSNMSKVVDGKLLKREDGKILKPESYFEPDLQSVLFEINNDDE